MKKITYVILAGLFILGGCEAVDTQTRNDSQPLELQQGEYRMEDGTVIQVTPGQQIVYPDGTTSTYMPDAEPGNYGQTATQQQVIYSQPVEQPQEEPAPPVAPARKDPKGVVYPVGLESQSSGDIQEQRVEAPTAAPRATIPQQQGVVYPRGAAPARQQGVVYPQGAAPARQQGVVYPQGAAPARQQGVVYPQGAAPARQQGVVYPQGAAPAPQQGVVEDQQSAVQPQDDAPQSTIYTRETGPAGPGYPEGALVVEINGKKQVYLPAKDNAKRSTGQPQVVYPQ